MTAGTLLYTIGEIDDKYILSAQKRLGLLAPEKLHSKGKSARHTARRVLVALAAALIMLFGSFTVAMAVNEDFREAVFTFLGIEQKEIVPEYEAVVEYSQGEVELEEKTSLGGVIEGSYIHTPFASWAAGGAFLVCTDEVQMKQGSRYAAYKEENGELVELELNSFNKTVSVRGNAFPMDFEWAETEGRSVITYVEASAPYYFQNFAGSPEATLVLFTHWENNGDEGFKCTSYPVLLNLRTGELTDILAGAGAEDLGEIVNAAISEDKSKMLLNLSGLGVYYADLGTKELYSVEELSGESLDDCSLIGNTLACWKLEEGDDSAGAFGKYRAWAIDLATFERRELFDFASCGRKTLFRGFNTYVGFGNMYAGSCFAIQTDEEQNTYIADLLSGDSSRVEGFRWPESFPYLGGIPSPDGRKLLVYGQKQDNCFEYIGVLDFDGKTYIQFSRENPNEVEEFMAYWLDNERVVIRCEESEITCDYYIYRLM